MHSRQQLNLSLITYLSMEDAIGVDTKPYFELIIKQRNVVTITDKDTMK